ncbi:MAG TPA: rhodanese-like domain-containing protein [Anaeromyxobacter sp.]|nr:rhodanese-like domain-containing protein [Anaeromyxobacter sp.]
MAPYGLTAGTIGYALTFGAIGFGFGAVLEMGGFGDTRKLAGQFYLRDMTVLKVMFTAIVVAAVLVAGASAFGLLDMSRVWVNPTYLWPGIVGGLIMGVGFIIGGFCPGTSVVAASTLKIDGMIFLAGALSGVYLFGETVSSFESFFLSSYMGRFTLDEWLRLPIGATVLLVAAAALVLFWLGELAERHFGRGEPWPAIALRPRSAGKLAGASALLAAGLVLVVRGQPTPAERWSWTSPEVKRAVAERGIFVHPAEVVALRKDLTVQSVILDLRDEHDFNVFHVGGARRASPEALLRPEEYERLLAQPASTVTFLVGNGEGPALETWKGLKALGVPNLYVIEGGINRWLELYPVPECVATRGAAPGANADALAFRFAYATGESEPAAWPELATSKAFRTPCEEAQTSTEPQAHAEAVWPSYAFTKRVKLQTKAAVKGGCG